MSAEEGAERPGILYQFFPIAADVVIANVSTVVLANTVIKPPAGHPRTGWLCWAFATMLLKNTSGAAPEAVQGGIQPNPSNLPNSLLSAAGVESQSLLADTAAGGQTGEWHNIAAGYVPAGGSITLGVSLVSFNGTATALKNGAVVALPVSGVHVLWLPI